MTASPFIMRLATGCASRRTAFRGTDVAGTVEAVGSGVHAASSRATRSSAGATARSPSTRRPPRTHLALKPANLTFEQAAAVPWPASTALQALRDDGKVQAGQKVLINGASGGVGTFAVQIAKALGAEVTGVTSTRNVDLVRSIGADHVIDYTQRGLHASGRALRPHPRQRRRTTRWPTRRALTPTGRSIPNGGGHIADGKLRPHRPGGRRCSDVRAPAGSATSVMAHEPRRPGRPQGAHRGRARSRRSSTGPTR